MTNPNYKERLKSGVKVSRAFFNAAMRNDFELFVEYAFGLVHPEQTYVDNWHIWVMAHELKKIANGQNNRLIISLPPRHLKSFVTSVAFPAWILGKFPGKKLVCASYSAELAGAQTKGFRSLVSTPEYQAIFGNMRIRSGSNTETEQRTTRNGGRLTTSVGGTLTGRGGDIIIVDDPIKADDAVSLTKRRRVNAWFDNSLLTRLDNQNEGAIIIVMQRVHEDDLAGHILAVGAEDWTLVEIPARATTYKEYDVDNDQIIGVEIGEVLCPKLLGEDELKRLERSMGSSNFQAQYLQRPIPLDGNLIKSDWIRSYDQLPPMAERHAIVQSWDTAIATGTSNDYSVCTTWLVSPNGLYLMDVFRDKLEFPTLLQKAQQLVTKFNANLILVENASSGVPLSQTMKGQIKNAQIVAVNPVHDKEARLRNCSYMFENGLVRVPAQAEWLHSFRSEILAFPAARNDDQVDSVSQFLNYMITRTIGGFKFDPSGKMIKRRSARGRTNLTYGSWVPPEELMDVA